MSVFLLYAGTFFTVLLITFLIAFLLSRLYIHSKRRGRHKYHFSSPAEVYSIRRDFELKPTAQAGIDGDTALSKIKR